MIVLMNPASYRGSRCAAPGTRESVSLPLNPPYGAVAIRAPRENSMQPEFPVQRPELRRLDQLAVRDTNGVQRSLKLLPPEGEEAMQFGKFGEQIIVLPDVGLQQPAMIR